MQWNKVIFAVVFSLFGIFVVAKAEDTSKNILIQHGDISVTEEDFDYILNIAIPEESRETFLGDQTKVRRLVADIFVTRALAAQAREIGLHKQEEMQFKMAFQQDKLLMDEVLIHYEETADQPDFDQITKERYKVEKENYRAPEMVKASHILIKISEERPEEKAKELADLVSQKLHNKEADFETLAVEYSEDPTAASNKGNLGYFARNQMVKPFADAAFSMNKEGEISEPVKTQFGYHIIRYEGRKPSRYYTYEEVKDRLIEQEKVKFRSNIRKEKIEQIRLLDGIEVSQEAITRLSQKGKK